MSFTIQILLSIFMADDSSPLTFFEDCIKDGIDESDVKDQIYIKFSTNELIDEMIAGFKYGYEKEKEIKELKKKLETVIQDANAIRTQYT